MDKTITLDGTGSAGNKLVLNIEVPLKTTTGLTSKIFFGEAIVGSDGKFSVTQNDWIGWSSLINQSTAKVIVDYYDATGKFLRTHDYELTLPSTQRDDPRNNNFEKDVLSKSGEELFKKSDIQNKTEGQQEQASANKAVAPKTDTVVPHKTSNDDLEPSTGMLY